MGAEHVLGCLRCDKPGTGGPLEHDSLPLQQGQLLWAARAAVGVILDPLEHGGVGGGGDQLLVQLHCHQQYEQGAAGTRDEETVDPDALPTRSGDVHPIHVRSSETGHGPAHVVHVLLFKCCIRSLLVHYKCTNSFQTRVDMSTRADLTVKL